MFEEKFPINVYRFFVLLVQNDGIVFNTQLELNFLLRKAMKGSCNQIRKTPSELLAITITKSCLEAALSSSQGAQMAVGASAQYARLFPQKTYKQMNFITQNTSKVDFWAGNGQEKLSFLTY